MSNKSINKALGILTVLVIVFSFYACKNQAIIRNPRYFDSNNSQSQETVTNNDSVVQYVGTSVNGEYIKLKIGETDIAILVDLLSIEDKYNKTNDTVIRIDVFESTGSSENFKEWIEKNNKE